MEIHFTSGRSPKTRHEHSYEYPGGTTTLSSAFHKITFTNMKQKILCHLSRYIYTHLKAYEPHAKKTLKKQEQSTSIVDPLAYVAHTTSAPPLSSPSSPSPQPTAQSPNDSIDGTILKIANLLSGFQKQFPPTNNQLRTSSNLRTHATVHDGHIVTEPVQRKALSNVGNTDERPNALSLSWQLVIHKSNQQFQSMRRTFRLDLETEIDDNTILYHQYLLDTEVQNVPTEVSADTSHKVSMIAIFTDLQTQLDGHAKVNQEKCLEVETLKNELLQYKQEICRQDTTRLKSTLSGKEKSIAFLQSEKEKILSEKKDLADSYLDEIVCLKNANKVARDMLQRFNMPTHTIPMLSKKPKAATADLHKDLLGTRNPGLGYMAKRAQPVLYDADTLLHPTHHPVSIWDSEEVLVHQVVSMKKMNEKPGHVRPENGFYEKLNALKFCFLNRTVPRTAVLASCQ
ncbi:hypothetical protein Tco_0432592 [Tanacetum coccineum]